MVKDHQTRTTSDDEWLKATFAPRLAVHLGFMTVPKKRISHEEQRLQTFRRFEIFNINLETNEIIGQVQPHELRQIVNQSHVLDHVVAQVDFHQIPESLQTFHFAYEVM